MKRTCRALKHGFDGVKVREPGEIFDYGGSVASWFEEIASESESTKAETPKVDPEEAEKKNKKDKKSTGDKEVI